MSSLAEILSTLVQDAFEALDLPRELGAVRVSDRPDLAQFQCNGAMAAAKVAKKAPRDIAIAIVEQLNAQEAIEIAEVAGPGFININANKEFINKYLSNFAQNKSFGFLIDSNEKTIVLDYGGPNVAKAMHVGHLRASIIGDALRRMYAYAGYKTYSDVHLGDWGLPMGQILSELEIRYPDWPYFSEGEGGSYPETSPVTIEDLAEIYPQASQACKDNEDRLKLARDTTAKLQDGHKGYRALWQHFIDVSIAAIKENFDALDVHFDLWLGESDAHDTIAPMVEDLKSKNLAEQSDGALVVPLQLESDTKELPPLILYKSDGAVMYGTTDLATIVDRVRDYDPYKIIYVVDQRQSLHFEQVFRTAVKANFIDAEDALIHAGFGTMNGSDGKPFKTRAGGVMKLDDLIGMAKDKAHKRLNEASLSADFSDEERDEIANLVGLAAIKFADLQNNRVSDYVFDLDRMTSFEGKTGPYLLYQLVRIKSLLRRAKEKSFMVDGAIDIQEEDQSLALLLTEFSDNFSLSLSQNSPHILCDYVYKIAQSFSSFYAAVHIMSEQDEALRGSRLALCALTANVLETLLNCIGIKVPDRM